MLTMTCYHISISGIGFDEENSSKILKLIDSPGTGFLTVSDNKPPDTILNSGNIKVYKQLNTQLLILC